MNFERTREICGLLSERVDKKHLRGAFTCLVLSYPWILPLRDLLILQILDLALNLIAQCPCLPYELVKGGSILLSERLVRVVQRPRVQVRNSRHIRVELSKLVLDARYL